MHALLRVSLGTLLILSLSRPVMAQPDQFIGVSDTLSSNGDSFVVNVRGMASMRVQPKDSYSGTWEVQCSVDGGVTYATDDEVNLFLEGASSAAVQSVTDTVGIWTATVAGCSHIKVIATAGFAASDTTIAIGAVASGGSSSGGGSAGGANTTDADDASIAAAQTNDNANSLNMAYDGSVWRRLTFYTNDGTAAGTTFLPVLPGLVETSAPTRTNGRMAGMSFTAGGAARVMVTDAAGAATTIATDVTEDAAETAGGTGPMVMTVRRDVAASSAGTTGDNATSNTDALGLLWTRALDPCSGVAKQYLSIDIVTATTTEITASLAGASTHYYICSIALVTAGANNVAIVDDDTDNCASVTSGVMGGFGSAAEGFNLAANGGLTFGNGASSIARTGGTNRVLCIITSAAVQLSGTITVVAAP
jgi:hypothetical protein